jgi:hypothetical protein
MASSISIDEPVSLSRHREMLWAATLAVTFAFLLQAQSSDHVAFRLLPDFPLPQVCFTRAWFNIDCPGCGLTRSVIHLVHGDWSASFRMHRVGPLIALALSVQFPYRFYGIYKGQRWPLGRLLPRMFGYLLIAALIGNWLYNLHLNVQ